MSSKQHKIKSNNRLPIDLPIREMMSTMFNRFKFFLLINLLLLILFFTLLVICNFCSTIPEIKGTGDNIHLEDNNIDHLIQMIHSHELEVDSLVKGEEIIAFNEKRGNLESRYINLLGHHQGNIIDSLKLYNKEMQYASAELPQHLPQIKLSKDNDYLGIQVSAHASYSTLEPVFQEMTKLFYRNKVVVFQDTDSGLYKLFIVAEDTESENISLKLKNAGIDSFFRRKVDKKNVINFKELDYRVINTYQ